jgi:hypothetical protein
MKVQTNFYGHFRPVGSTSFGESRQKPSAFDQQPVEASATIAACTAAWRYDRSAEWESGATLAFAWFMGENDLRSALVDSETGRCWDGLHPDRPNENTGAESTLSYLLGLIDIRQLSRDVAINRSKSASSFVSLVAERPMASLVPKGSSFDSTRIPQPASPLSTPGSGQSGRQAVQAGD